MRRLMTAMLAMVLLTTACIGGNDGEQEPGASAADLVHLQREVNDLKAVVAALQDAPPNTSIMPGFLIGGWHEPDGEQNEVSAYGQFLAAAALAQDYLNQGDEERATMMAMFAYSQLGHHPGCSAETVLEITKWEVPPGFLALVSNEVERAGLKTLSFGEWGQSTQFGGDTQAMPITARHLENWAPGC